MTIGKYRKYIPEILPSPFFLKESLLIVSCFNDATWTTHITFCGHSFLLRLFCTQRNRLKSLLMGIGVRITYYFRLVGE